MTTSSISSRILAVGIAISGFALAQSNAAVPFSDNFSTNHNYVTNGVTGTGWDGILNSGNLSVGTAGGGVLNWNTTGQWDNQVASGAFLYLSVTGDFSASVQAHDTETGSGFPVAGLLALDPTSTLPTNGDWAFVDRHVFGANVFFNSVNGSVPSNGNPSAGLGSAGEYLRLDRTGTVFTAYAKLNSGDSWTQIAAVDRTDIPSNIYLGLVGSSGGSSNFQFSNFSIVPEPGSATLAAMSLGLLALRRKRAN